MPARIAIIEDTQPIAADLERIITAEGEFSLAGTFASAEAGIAALQQLQPPADLLICDIGLPGMDGLAALKHLREKLPALKIVLFTVFEDSDRIIEAIQNGANGYLLKDTPPELLVSELKTVLLGGATLTPRVAQKISQLLPGGPGVDDAPEGMLTEKQAEILNLVALGFDYREIADELDISAHTVRRHIENIYERLQVNNKREAIRAGFKFGFLKNIAKWVS